MKKLIVLEINEVPFKVYDHYIQNNPDTVLAKILTSSSQFVTKSTDTGELHPWSTWPTFYRGVDNTKHLIKDIGEDLTVRNKEFPSVWEILVDKDISVGVFSSLHTHPLPENVNRYNFLVPDPFANGSETHPASVEPFQSFNLAMTRKSGRSVDKGIDKKAALRLAASLPKLGIRFSTLLSVANQLISERINPWKAIRRRTFQSVLAFDLFFKLLKKEKPDFVTFFSNHVASAMHRYWAATFPEDYKENDLPQEWIKRYKNEIPYCMDQLDQMVEKIEHFIKKNPEYKLVIASSMGQEATNANLIYHELFLSDYQKLSKVIGTEIKPLSAMHPQYNFSVDHESADRVEEQLGNMKINGKPLSFRRKESTFFSIDLGYPNISDFQISLGSSEISLEETGFEIRKIDDQSGGTAYHIPEGTFFVYDYLNPVKSTERKEVDLRSVAPAILNYFNVTPPSYMDKNELVI